MVEKKITARKRAKTLRSRTGCIVCRSRHVKCDEQKPSCVKCQISGNVCQFVMNHPYFSPGFFSNLPPNPLMVASLNLSAVLPQADKERRYFHHFQERTVPEISAFCDQDFWSVSLLQISRSEAAVRHAVIALGALHESTSREDSPDDGGLRTFALQQYNKSIVSLRRYLSADGKQSFTISLICCLLFVWFERLLGHREALLTQFRSGLRIAREWQRTFPADASKGCLLSAEEKLIRECILPLYIRLDIQATTFVEGHQLQLATHLQINNTANQDGIPSRFSSVEEAQDWSAALMYWISYPAKVDATPAVFPMSPDVSSPERAPHWTSSLPNPLSPHRPSSTTKSQLRLQIILQIYKLITTIMYRTQISAHEAEYDPFTPAFERVIELAEEVLHLSTPASKSPPSPVSLSSRSSLDPEPETLDGNRHALEVGVVTPLLYVGGKCRNQTVRERSIAVFLKCPPRPRPGSLWNMLGAANLTSRVLEGEIGGEGWGEEDADYDEEMEGGISPI